MNADVLDTDFDAFTSIEQTGFDVLSGALGRSLVSASQEVFLPIEEQAVGGAIELRFSDRLVLLISDAHSGLCVYPHQIHADPDSSDVPTQIDPLELATPMIGFPCRDVLIALEPVQLHGKGYITAGKIFDFQPLTLGYENFFHRWGTERSQVVVDPDWSHCKLVSLATGGARESPDMASKLRAP